MKRFYYETTINSLNYPTGYNIYDRVLSSGSPIARCTDLGVTERIVDALNAQEETRKVAIATRAEAVEKGAH